MLDFIPIEMGNFVDRPRREAVRSGLEDRKVGLEAWHRRGVGDIGDGAIALISCILYTAVASGLHPGWLSSCVEMTPELRQRSNA